MFLCFWGSSPCFLVYMVLGFESLFSVNKYSCIFIRKPLSPAWCDRACNPILPGYIPHGEMAGLSGLSHLVAAVGWYADGDTGGKQGKETTTDTGRRRTTTHSPQAGAAAQLAAPEQ